MKDVYDIVKDILSSGLHGGTKLMLLLVLIAAIIVTLWAREKFRARSEREIAEAREKLRAEAEREIAETREKLRVQTEHEIAEARRKSAELDAVARAERADAVWAREWENGVERRLTPLTPLARRILCDMCESNTPLILVDVEGDNLTVNSAVYLNKSVRYDHEPPIAIYTAIKSLLDCGLVTEDARLDDASDLSSSAVYFLTKSGARLAKDAQKLTEMRK